MWCSFSRESVLREGKYELVETVDGWYENYRLETGVGKLLLEG